MYTVCTTTINFNIDEGLKNAATKKARQKGVSLSTVLNQATRAFVAGTLDIGIIDCPLTDDIARSDEDIKHGRVTSHDDALKELGLLGASSQARWRVLLLRVRNDAEDTVGGAMDFGNAKPSTRGCRAPKPVTLAHRGMPDPHAATAGPRNYRSAC